MNVRTLGFSATMIFTLFFVTHISIFTSDFSRIFSKIPSSIIQNVLLPLKKVYEFGDFFKSP